MPSPVPTPVAAALGLVPTVLGGVRRLPGKAAQLPVYAVSYTLTGIGTARQGYDNLAERGERLIARLRGTSFDELEDAFEDRLQGTPLARPYDRVEDALEDATEGVASLARKSSARARNAAGSATRTVGGGLEKAADKTEDAAEKAGTTANRASKTTAKATPKPGKSTAKAASTADKTADKTEKAAGKLEGKVDEAADKVESTVDKAAEKTKKAADKVEDKADAAADKTKKAAGKVEDKVEKATDEVQDKATGAAATAEQSVPEAEAPKGEPTPQATQPDHTRVDTAASSEVVQTVEEVSATVSDEVLPHDELPLPDYDHLTLGSLRGRMRSLDLPQLVQIRDYEKAHADRLPIVTMLDNRIAKLASDPTAPLSGSSPDADVPAKPKPTRGGSKVSPATGGPALNAPNAGVPTNPAQPRTTGSPGTNPHSEA